MSIIVPCVIFEGFTFFYNKTNMETLRNYSFYIKNYTEYINKQIDKIIINFNLNEISKIYYQTSSYNEKNLNSYTNIYLNTDRHISHIFRHTYTNTNILI